VNIQEYISSGIVESYVLGLAEPAERAEFERLCLEFPELVEARNEFELELEAQAFAGAVAPPASLKNQILASIDLKGEDSAPLAIVSPLPPRQDSTVSEAPVRWMNRLKFLAAASLILLVASTALNFYFFSQYQNYSSLYKDLLSSRDQLASANNVMQAKVQAYENTLNVIRDRDMLVVPMPGSNVPTSPNKSSLATVYWNQRTRDVYLLVNNMPVPASDKQYQLWALVDGKPVDAGVFDASDPTAFIRLKNIPNAQGFAVTLEKKGGAVSPTMEQMYVLGLIKA
jgi:anti-sigma-K factor RskA